MTSKTVRPLTIAGVAACSSIACADQVIQRGVNGRQPCLHAGRVSVRAGR
jgi:hypothetical protein